jgi:hypothetical protein
METSRNILRNTGQNRFRSGAATKNTQNLKKQMQNRYRRKSMGGSGG